ncbi:unnamed protein product [Symbiodinium microadriaticum]|nr:unnamed protein product [Symbiodinium microadriaticum]
MSAIPNMMQSRVQEITMDGHEKIATKYYQASPTRGGRPRSDGHEKNYRWWTDPASGCIVGVVGMLEPDNNKVVLTALSRSLVTYKHVDCVLYDRMCFLMPSATSRNDMKKAKHAVLHMRRLAEKLKLATGEHMQMSMALTTMQGSLEAAVQEVERDVREVELGQEAQRLYAFS